MAKNCRSATNTVGGLAAAALAACLWLEPAGSQVGDSRLEGDPTAEFHFARLVYRNSPSSRRGRGWGGGGAWSTDYADAEYHLMQGVNRLTRVDGQAVDYYGDGGRLITLDDDRLFDYPWLYAVEVGQWETQRLGSRVAPGVSRPRRILDGGRFLGGVRVVHFQRVDAAGLS